MRGECHRNNLLVGDVIRDIGVVVIRVDVFGVHCRRLGNHPGTAFTLSDIDNHLWNIDRPVTSVRPIVEFLYDVF